MKMLCPGYGGEEALTIRNLKKVVKFLSKFRLVLLISTLLYLTSIVSFGSGTLGDEDKSTKGQNVTEQKQYTSLTLEPTTVRQIQSIQVEPEILLLSRQNVVYVDSIVNSYIDKIEFMRIKENEERMKLKRLEAKAYLFVLIPTLLVSALGVFIGKRTEDLLVAYLSSAIFLVSFILTLIKIPLLIL